ncbi:MAG TPA: M36 family metallopeptidase, partial [Chloroflexota bacterium]|nr:M36 family metallopeptidase [Chloroflexota bacterium]
MTRIIAIVIVLIGLLLVTLSLTTFAQATHQSGDFTRQYGAGLDAQAIALAHLEQSKARLGLTAADLAEAKITDITVSRLSGVTTIYLGQQLDGIEVFNGRINISIMPNGDVLTVGNRFVSDLTGSVSDRTASITAAEAVQAAAAHLKLTIQTPLQTIEQTSGPAQETLLSDGGISQNPIPAKLVYDASGKEVRLAWNVIIYQLDGLHWWNVRIDAHTGDVLSQNDWVAQDHVGLPMDSGVTAGQFAPVAPTPVADGSSYRVFHLPVESPSHASPPAPADGRTLQNQPADAIGSPFGWHDVDGAAGAEFTTTQGNNVHAYTDTDSNNIPDPDSSPDGGTGLDFDFPLDLTQPPSAYRPASVINLFHWNNLMHDVSYRYGFDEIHGNFQENNYANGGLGSDYVNAEAQEGIGTNCGNFATPPDGVNPRMQMCIWTLSTPHRDGALDNSVVAHEYGHGITSRMVGGPSNVGCVSNAEAMIEGWADWQALIMTMENGDQGTDSRGLGTYVLNQPPSGVGLRPSPYTTDMTVNSYTYADLPGVSGAHGVGFVWATMLWEMNWALITRHGFNEDLYPPDPPVNTWSGNQLAHALVMEGLNLTPCGPGFVDGRNAILNADMALTGGENQCTIWAAFAKRGLGFSASQGSPNNTNDGTAAFDMPPSCQGLDVTPTSQDICQGETAVYTVGVGEAFTPPVTMSATGNPVP